MRAAFELLCDRPGPGGDERRLRTGSGASSSSAAGGSLGYGDEGGTAPSSVAAAEAAAVAAASSGGPAARATPAGAGAGAGAAVGAVDDGAYVTLPSFQRMMAHYSKRKSATDVFLLFVTLDVNNQGVLSREAFSRFYEFEGLTWRQVVRRETQPQAVWWERALHAARRPVYQLVEHKYFDYFIDLSIVANALVVVTEAALVSSGEYQLRDENSPFVRIDIAFAALYCTEMLLKMFGLGLKGYFSVNWNRFDCLITTAVAIGQIFQNKANFFVMLRPIRLLRLFGTTDQFRAIIGTLGTILPKLSFFFLVLVAVYYSFAIVGMEAFGGVVQLGCCNSTYFDGSDPNGLYYLNNFDDLTTTYLVLYVVSP